MEGNFSPAVASEIRVFWSEALSTMMTSQPEILDLRPDCQDNGLSSPKIC